MNRFFKDIIITLIFLDLFYCRGFSLDDREKFRPQSQPPAYPQPPQQAQDPQPPRPILPPIIPSSPLGLSPSPSPQITAPSVTPATITMPSSNINYQPATIQASFQSSPARAVLPTVNVPTELPQIPIIGNSLGKVINTGSGKDGLTWIEVKDEIFNETLKIKINPKSTPVIKKSTAIDYRDIKIGDVVSVIFNQQEENIVANFISVLTEEDLKVMEESLKSGPDAKTENQTKDNASSKN